MMETRYNEAKELNEAFNQNGSEDRQVNWLRDLYKNHFPILAITQANHWLLD